MSFLSKLRSRLSPEAVKRTVRFDDDGFTVVVKKEEKAQVPWSSVREVFAFKHDLFSIDEICLGFRIDASGTYYWAGEGDVGFKELMVEVERRLPGIRTDWFGEVAVPAFSENRTTIWGEPFIQREKEGQQAS